MMNQFDTDGYVNDEHLHECPARYGVGDCDSDCIARNALPLGIAFPHYHDTDSSETGWCSGCGRTDLAVLADVWCSRCELPATVERTRDDETIALCHEHDVDEQWRANSPSWK